MDRVEAEVVHPDDGKEIEVAENVYVYVEVIHVYGAPSGCPYQGLWSVGGEDVERRTGRGTLASSRRKAYEWAYAQARRIALGEREGR